MQKFYVQSGSASWLVLANSEADAALRFVQTVMKDSFIGGKQPTSSYRLVDQARAQKLVSKLTGKISIGEQGFDSPPKCFFDTNEFLKKWQKQVSSLERLIRKS